jgi:hypothetical protein
MCLRRHRRRSFTLNGGCWYSTILTSVLLRHRRPPLSFCRAGRCILSIFRRRGRRSMRLCFRFQTTRRSRCGSGPQRTSHRRRTTSSTTTSTTPSSSTTPLTSLRSLIKKDRLKPSPRHRPLRHRRGQDRGRRQHLHQMPVGSSLRAARVRLRSSRRPFLRQSPQKLRRLPILRLHRS